VTVGRRNDRNVKAGILDVLQWGLIKHRVLFTTDGFEIHEWAVKRLLSGVCIYGQAIKKRRENRVIRADRKLILGTKAELNQALFDSEDAQALNTSFVERHHLTIRKACCCLFRRTPSHAHQSKPLTDQVASMMLNYNFLQPHMVLTSADWRQKRSPFGEIRRDFFPPFCRSCKNCRLGFASWGMTFISTTPA